MAKYPGVTAGQTEACINRLGGWDSFVRFIGGAGRVVWDFLTHVTELTLPSVSRFVAADAFGQENPAGIKFYFWGNFKKHFLEKVEEDVPERNITIHRLERASRDPAIRAELGENHTITLAHLYELIKTQPQGEEGPLLTNGYANIAYIEDAEGTVWAVNAHWHSSRRRWLVNADSVEPPHEWGVGRRVLS